MAKTNNRRLPEQEAAALLREEMAEPRKAHSVRVKEAKEEKIANKLARSVRGKRTVETPVRNEHLIP